MEENIALSRVIFLCGLRFQSPTQMQKPTAFRNSAVKQFKEATKKKNLVREHWALQAPSFLTSKWEPE